MKNLYYEIQPVEGDKVSITVKAETGLDAQLVGLQITLQMFRQMADHVPEGMENYAGALTTARDAIEKVMFEATNAYLSKHNAVT